MSLEEEIFSKNKIIYEKLIPFGFSKINDSYVISKNILDDSFIIKVIINNDKIIARVFDTTFEDEYILYRFENKNDFALKVASLVTSFLKEIKDSCTTSNYFYFSQANNIASLIYQRYHDVPDFPWPDLPNSGVFRNPLNQKWYGLIMAINKQKLLPNSKDNSLVEIINIKLDSQEIDNLIDNKNFFRAYHMNKKNWLSILLEGQIDDETIMSYIDKSHDFTIKKSLK